MTDKRKRSAQHHESMPLSWPNMLRSACQHRKSLRMVQFLVKTTSKDVLQSRNVDGNTVLHLSCSGPTHSLEIVNYLVQKIPEALLMENNDRFTPLDLAMRQEDINLDLIAVLLGHWPSLELELKAGYMSCSLGPDVTRMLTLYSFKSLDLSKVHLPEDGLLAFLIAMAANTTLQNLTLNFFEYTENEVCSALEEMLARNRNLKSLTLHVRMQPVMASQRLGRALVNGLKVNHTLTVLDLSTIPQYRLRLLMPMDFRMSLHQVDRVELDHYLWLNRAGRDRFKDTGLTKREFVRSIAPVSDNVSVLFDLLRMVPHVWTQ